MKDEHQESKDEDSLFELSIAVSLRRLDPQKKSLANIRMQQVLYEVEFLHLFLSSRVSPHSQLTFLVLNNLYIAAILCSCYQVI